jgi:MFS transporter, UMF1 family
LRRYSTKKNDLIEISGWVLYDWANHAYWTLILGVLVGEYITGLAQSAVGENGALLRIGGHDLVTAKSLYSYAVSFSVLLQVFFLPTLGAIADYTHLKKTFMAVFCYIGAVSCALLFFIYGGLYWWGAALFIVTNLSAGASSVFANSYLNDLTTEDNRDRVSSWGFGIGYLGGFITLIIGALIIFNAPKLQISTEYAVRICFLFAGLWWGGFAVITFALLKPRAPVRDLPASRGYISASFGELRDTFRELFKLKQTLRFLAAYLLYNDGIQTVIAMSAVFLSQELFVAHGLDPDRTVLIFAFMIAQAIGFVGALLFERVSHYTSAKTSIIITLVIWSGIVIYAYGFLQTVTEAYIMSGFIGLVLGGSQALSRSLFSQMIPAGRESAFFGLYAISERGTSWVGPFVFGLVAQLTDSYRPAILALIAFFVVGIIILYFVDTAHAIHDAGNATPDEAAHGMALSLDSSAEI